MKKDRGIEETQKRVQRAVQTNAPARTKRARMWRVLRRSLIVILPAVAAIALARDHVLLTLVWPRVQAPLEEALGLELSLSSVELDWGGALHVNNLQSTGSTPRSGVKSLSLVTATVRYSYAKLLMGESDWLEQVRLERPELELDLTREPLFPALGSSTGSSESPETSLILPDIQIEDARVHLTTESGTLRLDGAGLTVSGPDAELTIRHLEGSGDFASVAELDGPLVLVARLGAAAAPFDNVTLTTLELGTGALFDSVHLRRSRHDDDQEAWNIDVELAAPSEGTVRAHVSSVSSRIRVDAPCLALDPFVALLPGAPELSGSVAVSADVEYENQNQWTADVRAVCRDLHTPQTTVALAEITLAGSSVHPGLGHAGLRPPRLEGTLLVQELRFPEATFQEGRLAEVPAIDGLADFSIEDLPPGGSGRINFEDVSLYSDLGECVASGVVSLANRTVAASVEFSSTLDDLLVDGDTSPHVGGTRGGTLGGTLSVTVRLDGALDQLENALLQIEATATVLSTNEIHHPTDVTVAARMADCTVAVERFRLAHGESTVELSVQASSIWPLDATVDSIRLAHPALSIASRSPVRVLIGDGHWSVESGQLKLLRPPFPGPCGTEHIEGGGEFSFVADGNARGEAQLFITAGQVDLATLATLLPRESPLGTANAELGISIARHPMGHRLESDLIATIEGGGLRLGGRSTTGIDAQVAIEMRDGDLRVQTLNVQQEGSSVTVSGTVPLELLELPTALLELVEEVDDESEQLDLEFEAKIAELARLPALPASLREASGTATVQGRLSGDLSVPRLDADLVLENATCKLHGGLPPLRDVEAHLTIRDEVLRLQSVTGRLREAKFSCTGALRYDYGSGLKQAPSLHPREVDVRLQVDDALLLRERDLRVRGSLDLRWHGLWANPIIAGRVDIARAYYLRDVELAPGRSAGLPLRLFSFEDPPLRNLRFNLELRSRGGLIVRNNVAATRANVDLLLHGTGFEPILVGTVFTDAGTVRVGGLSKLNVKTARLEFVESAPLDPNLEIVLGATLQNHEVSVRVGGTLTVPEVLMDSSPSLPSDDLLILIATGRTVAQINEQGLDRIVAIEAARYLGQRIAEQLSTADPTEESVLDRVSVEAESGPTRYHDDLIRVEYRVLEDVFFRRDHVFIQGERDIYGDLNVNAGIRFEID